MIGSVCTDGAPAMLCNRSGFAAMLKKKIPELKVTHCLLHQLALAFKILPLCLKDALKSENRELHQRSCFKSPIVSVALPKHQLKRQPCSFLQH